MSNPVPKHLLSAAVDNAATQVEWDDLLQAVGNDIEIKAEWSRIWEWRDARDNVALAASEDFCSGVMAAIASDKALPSNVVAMPARRAAPRPARGARSWRTLVPLSAAAGVIAALLVVGGFRGNPGDSASTLQATGSAPLVATTAVNLPDEAKAAILNDYLMEHSNSLAERSMGRTLANAGFVVRTANYPSEAR